MTAADMENAKTKAQASAEQMDADPAKQDRHKFRRSKAARYAERKRSKRDK
jgi:hypothetical protein